MSIYGIGTDICALARIEAGLARFGDKFLYRVLAPAEREGLWGARQLARRWAMKEAVAKATGFGVGAKVGFHDILIMRDEHGKPHCTVRGFEAYAVHVSASDDGAYATAYAVIESPASGVAVCPELGDK